MTGTTDPCTVMTIVTGEGPRTGGAVVRARAVPYVRAVLIVVVVGRAVKVVSTATSAHAADQVPVPAESVVVTTSAVGDVLGATGAPAQGGAVLRSPRPASRRTIPRTCAPPTVWTRGVLLTSTRM